jgi:DhnA family fructose-bisphosphate aldolase class Ia
MEAVVRTVVEANPDAVQLSPGQAHLLESIPDKAKPALVLVRDLGVPAR